MIHPYISTALVASLFFMSTYMYAGTSQQQWQQWLTERNQFLKTDPESPLALEDAYNLQNKETIYLSCTSKNYKSCKWMQNKINKDQLSLTYSNSKLVIFRSGNKVAELQPGKIWKLKGEGLTIGSSAISNSSARVLVYNSQSPKITTFGGIKHFLFDSTSVVTAQVKKFKEPLLVELPTSTSKTIDAYKVGQITFRYKEQDATLDIYTFSTPNSLDLFIPFHDTTNGSTTYGGGRFVEPHLSSPQSKQVVVDFNQAHNPFCAYNALYSCVLSSGNDLNFSIEAGEQHHAK